MSAGDGSRGGLRRGFGRWGAKVLVLVLIAATCGCSAAANRARAYSAAKGFYQQLSSSPTEAQWGLREARVYGCWEISQTIAGGLPETTDLKDQPGKVLVTLPIWCEGKDAEGNLLRERRDLRMTLEKPASDAEFKVASWEFRNARPLTRLRQIVTCSLWCLGLTVALSLSSVLYVRTFLGVATSLNQRGVFQDAASIAKTGRDFLALLNIVAIGWICYVCFQSWGAILIGLVPGILACAVAYSGEVGIVRESPGAGTEVPGPAELESQAELLRTFLRGEGDAIVGKPADGPVSTHPWAQTPYRDLAPLVSATPNPPKDFDLFISYKSHDAELARRVAESLIADGLRVWFAEYNILLGGRAGFEGAIREGVRRSRFGLAFSNDHYAASEYCRLELGGLLAPENCGTERTLHVPLGDDRATLSMFPRAAACRTIPFRGEVNEVLDGVRQLTGMPVERMGPDPAGTEAMRCRVGDGSDYSLNVAGWEPTRRPGQETPFGVEGPAGRRTRNGCLTDWNLIAGPMVSPQTLTLDVSERNDDRKLYEVMLRFAYFYTHTQNASCTGVHLMHLGGRGHLGLTYWWERDNYWTRRFSIVLPDPRTGRTFEFAFTFAFFGPFREYCRQANDMDRVVQSLTWC